jgi:hypothetical protein
MLIIAGPPIVCMAARGVAAGFVKPQRMAPEMN